jgi:hypothetical protein
MDEKYGAHLALGDVIGITGGPGHSNYFFVDDRGFVTPTGAAYSYPWPVNPEPLLHSFLQGKRVNLIGAL